MQKNLKLWGNTLVLGGRDQKDRLEGLVLKKETVSFQNIEEERDGEIWRCWGRKLSNFCPFFSKSVSRMGRK